MILVSHHHGLARNNGTGYRVHEMFLDEVMSSGDAEPVTFDELHRRVKAGEVAMDGRVDVV